ncbi:Rrf2 family transcriptional regulator, partial [Escherichia coli]|uniref:Rrf2 family transcriptional regulator n=1 Tax=Escherichia coli TaxID=562 RepID=UPI0015B8CF5F
MRITSFTDYSLRTLMYLASLPVGQLSSVKEVSQFYNLPQNHMTKVVHQLSKSGYIQTLRGKGGG